MATKKQTHAKKQRPPKAPNHLPHISKASYKQQLYDLQVQLVRFQRELIAKDARVAIIIEGRDGAGKDGLIKRLTEHMAPRETRVVALPKPSDRDQNSWYFQRYVPHLPASGEFVIFNRSWYNRAGVEKVMGFCTPHQYQEFLDVVPTFEQMLIRSGIQLHKYFLDITKDEQKARLEARREDPLKQWKISPIDDKALELWDAYSEARNIMFERTTHAQAQWHVVRADNKKLARIEVIKDILSRGKFAKKDPELCSPDPRVVFPYDEEFVQRGWIAP